MTPRNPLFRRFRAYIKVLNVPAESHPRIARAAEEVGKPVALMAGVLWASYLAAYVSTSDEGLKDSFSLSLELALWLFVGATLVQIFQASRSKTALENAIYWLCYVGLGLVSMGLLGYSVGFLSGTQDFKRSDRQAQYDKISKCLADRASRQERIDKNFWQAIADHHACRRTADSDGLSIDLALAEQKISKQLWKLLADRVMERCKLDDVDKLQREMQNLSKENCDPDHLLKH